MRPDRRPAFRLAPVFVLLFACQTLPPAPPAAPVARPVAENWRAVALAADVERIERLAIAWEAGLSEARAADFAGRMAGLGATLEPAAALPRPTPPPGSWRCRVIRLGAGSQRRALTVYPAYFCHVGVEGALLSLTKQTGSERWGGYLFRDGEMRLVFLGTTMTHGDERAPAYGSDPARARAGIFERVGPMRYRLVLPGPRNGARLDVVELVPAPPPLD